MTFSRVVLLGCVAMLSAACREPTVQVIVVTDARCDDALMVNDLGRSGEDSVADATDAAITDLSDTQDVSDMGAATDATDAPDVRDASDARDGPIFADISIDVFRRDIDLCRPRPLPDRSRFVNSPRLIAPLSTTRVSSQRPTLRWEMPPGLVHPRVQICAEYECWTIRSTIDASLTDGGTRMQVRPSAPLTPGANFWRVVADAADGSETRSSYTWEFWVGRRDSPLDTSVGTISDIDGDRIDDVAVSSTGSLNAAINIYHGSSRGLFELPSQRVAAPSWAQESFGADLYVTDLGLNGYAGLVIDEGPGVPDHVADIHYFQGGGECVVFGERPWGGSSGLYSVGDVNGDGYPDFVKFGSPLTLLLGARGGFWPVRWERTPVCGFCRMKTLAGIGDVNGDGYADVAVSYYEPGTEDSDQVEIFLGSASGLHNERDFLIPVPELPYHWGLTMSSAGDLDGDGMGEFLISDAPRIYLYRGAVNLAAAVPVSSATPMELQGSIPMGAELSAPFDMNADGTPEIVFYSPSAPWDGGNGPGIVYLYEIEGLRFRLVDRINPAAWLAGGFGDRATIQSDVTGDGFTELLVLSGAATGGYLYEFDGTARPFLFSGSRYFVGIGAYFGYGFAPM